MKDFFSSFKTLSFWKEILVVIAGTFVAAVAVEYFIIPSKLILGSVAGLSIVLSTILEGMGIAFKASTLILLINAFLIVLAIVFLGKEVGAKTVVASLLIGPFIDLLDRIYPYTRMIQPGFSSVMGDPVVDLLAFVLLIGASQAILFRINASTGGLDIVAMIMSKYLHWDMGPSVTVSGIIVCLMGAFIHPVNMVILGVIGTWMNGVVVDYFTASLNRRKRVCIISPEYDRIRQYIIGDLQRGCSLFTLKGGYSGEEGVEVQALLTNSEFAKLMEFIRKNDINAFATAGNCSEVYGRWRGHKK
ncbi:MAG: YitT family protein [Bacteroidales bacterium]|nr:YitT family protein [Bacteroidales bacterium]